MEFSKRITDAALDGNVHVPDDFGDHDSDVYEVGDIVALVEETSTRETPQILLGKVLRTAPRKREALLAHLAPVPNTSKQYRITIGKGTWWENYSALNYPVDIVYEERKNTYTLRTSPQDIHSSWAQ